MVRQLSSAWPFSTSKRPCLCFFFRDHPNWKLCYKPWEVDLKDSKQAATCTLHPLLKRNGNFLLEKEDKASDFLCCMLARVSDVGFMFQISAILKFMYQVNSEVIEIIWFEDGLSAKHKDFFKSNNLKWPRSLLCLKQYKLRFSQLFWLQLGSVIMFNQWNIKSRQINPRLEQ